MQNKRGQSGFIKMTILIIVALVILKYAYDIDVVEYFIRGWEKLKGFLS